MAGQPKAPFYAVLAVVVAGLVWLGISRWDVLFPKANPKAPGGQKIDPNELGKAEDPANTTSVATVKEYTIVPAQRLPAVEGVSAYKPLADNTVRIALNVWAGWGPIVLANDGAKAGKVWKAPGGKDFKVELVLADDPVAMRAAYVSGDVHVGWATLDMVPLFMEGFVNAKDSRVMPRIFQQIDWSNGGDGIVVRKEIKNVGDLRGKKLALADNSPSKYFALTMLVAGGVQPSEVELIHTKTAFEAARLFEVDKSIAGCVSWAPDIYKLAEIKSNRMLVSTLQANKLIADVWFARADFAKDHPQIIEGLVRGIFDAMEEMKKQDRKQHCAKLLADFYGIPAAETIKMFGDAHNTNWAENYQFFVNQNNPTNFERVWRQAYYLYKRVGSIDHQPVPFDQVMDFTYIKKLADDPKYAAQKDEYVVQIAAKPVNAIKAESDPILTNTVVIHFYPNKSDPYFKVTKEVDGKAVEELYDPSVDVVLEEIAALTGKFGAARIIIQGHTDASMLGRVPATLVKELSEQRAQSVKDAVLKKFPNLNPKQFYAEGLGWDVPADEAEPQNHSKNRRVEIKVYAAEQQ